MQGLKKFVLKHKKSIKYTYIAVIICVAIYALYGIATQVSIKQIETAFAKLSFGKAIPIIVLGALAVIPMVIYDFVYTQKTNGKMHLPVLLKNSYITNTLTNALGGGGLIGANLRVYLFGKASKKVSETTKVVAQIALFTMFGLITNDLVAMGLNFSKLSTMPLEMKWGCGLFLLYIVVPFFIPNKTLNKKDYLWLIIGSSLEWLCALGFFLIVGKIMGISFNIVPAYLAVCFAGIIGAASFIPGGLGTFDSAIILGLHQLGISTSTAVAWALMYRICYYIIPVVIGLIMLLFTVIYRAVKKHQNKSKKSTAE